MLEPGAAVSIKVRAKFADGEVRFFGDDAEPLESALDLSGAALRVPATEPELQPILLGIPLQLLAYHAALALGRDIDKPRNLAKSVTVE